WHRPNRAAKAVSSAIRSRPCPAATIIDWLTTRVSSTTDGGQGNRISTWAKLGIGGRDLRFTASRSGTGGGLPSGGTVGGGESGVAAPGAGGPWAVAEHAGGTKPWQIQMRLPCGRGVFLFSSNRKSDNALSAGPGGNRGG